MRIHIKLFFIFPLLIAALSQERLFLFHYPHHLPNSIADHIRYWACFVCCPSLPAFGFLPLVNILFQRYNLVEVIILEIDSDCLRDLITAVNVCQSGEFMDVWENPILAPYDKKTIMESAQFLLAIYKS